MDKATYEELEVFIAGIADRCCDPVLKVQAQQLLRLEPEPYQDSMVDEIIDQAYIDDVNDGPTSLDEEMEAIILKYGPRPKEYVIEKLEGDGFPRGTNMAISWIAHLRNDEETLDRRRSLIEKRLETETSPRGCYYLLVALMSINDPRSLPSVIDWEKRNPNMEIVIHVAHQLRERLEKREMGE